MRMKKAILLHVMVPVGAAAVGALRLSAADLDFGALENSQIKEYLLSVSAGLFFGWALYSGVSWVFEGRRNAGERKAAVIAVAAPLLFLVLAHQTRGVINDGPATLALAAGYAISAIFCGRAAKAS